MNDTAYIEQSVEKGAEYLDRKNTDKKKTEAIRDNYLVKYDYSCNTTENLDTGQKNTPEPLPSMPEVMPFDFDYLPNVARGYVQDIGQRMQCPHDYLGVTVYAMLAAVIGRKVGIRPMKYDDWTVIPNLWAASIGNSGTLKSPAQSAALAPIKKLVTEACDRYKTELDYPSEAA